jgi:protease YdgD
MLRALLRGMPLVAAFLLCMFGAAYAAAIGPLERHREAVDEQSYPWSSVGKLFNESGASCSGVVIAQDTILTAAHCLYNARTGRLIPAEALHFLVGYRTGRYSAHARIVSYRIGPGFDPLRYDQTSQSDWAVLTVAGRLPAEIEPLRLRREMSAAGTKAMLAGYGRERAFAMTADRDCELRERVGTGQLLLHTCRSTFGYSGAPILVGTGGREVEVAGIQIAAMRSGGADVMIAVPAQAIPGQDRAMDDAAPAMAMPVFVSTALCPVSSDGGLSLPAIQARLDWQEAEAAAPDAVPPERSPVDTVAWLGPEPFDVAFP